MFNLFKKKNNQPPKSDIDHLAEQVALSVNLFSKNKKSEYLCYSKFTKLDTVIFACFLVRAMCLGASTNRDRAIDFSNKFIDKFTSSASMTYLPTNPNLFQRMFDNRVSFYDRVFMSEQGIENKISAILEEFEIIIKTDIVNGEYADFSETRPLPILSDGIFGDMKCNAEVVSFYQDLPVLLTPYFQNVQKSL